MYKLVSKQTSLISIDKINFENSDQYTRTNICIIPCRIMRNVLDERNLSKSNSSFYELNYPHCSNDFTFDIFCRTKTQRMSSLQASNVLEVVWLKVCSIAVLSATQTRIPLKNAVSMLGMYPNTAPKFPPQSINFCYGMQESTAFGTMRF